MHSPNITDPSGSTARGIGEGDNITITCKALGYPPPTIVWSKTNGTLSHRVSLSNSITTYIGISRLPYVTKNLTLTNANGGDAGLYLCTASNSVGRDVKNIDILVHCMFLYTVN